MPWLLPKNGPKLHEVKEGEASSGEPGIVEEYGVKIGHRVRMADWVGFISSELGAPFEDDTGLKGLYDFKLEWSPDATPRGGREPRDPDDGVFPLRSPPATARVKAGAEENSGGDVYRRPREQDP